MQKYKTDTAALDEVRLANFMGGYTIFWQVKPSIDKGESDVIFAISKNLKLDKVPVRYSDRIMTLTDTGAKIPS